VREVVPPLPVQLSVKLVVLARPLIVWLPEICLVPLQPPEAVQVVAFVELQVNIELPPLLTVAGLADRLTVGAGGGEPITVTVTERVMFPPPPVHCKV
jgi:hypothetical protein